MLDSYCNNMKGGACTLFNPLMTSDHLCLKLCYVKGNLVNLLLKFLTMFLSSCYSWS